jgi:hypothetical protein
MMRFLPVETCGAQRWAVKANPATAHPAPARLMNDLRLLVRFPIASFPFQERKPNLCLTDLPLVKTMRCHPIFSGTPRELAHPSRSKDNGNVPQLGGSSLGIIISFSDRFQHFSR